MSLQKLPEKVQEITNFTEAWFPLSDLDKIYEFEVALEDKHFQDIYVSYVRDFVENCYVSQSNLKTYF